MAEHQKKILNIGLDRNWVLKHQFDAQLPTDIIKAEVAKFENLTLYYSSFTSVSVLFDTTVGNCGELVSSIMDLFAVRYPEVSAYDVLVFQEVDFKGGDVSTTANPPEKSDDDLDEFEKFARRVSGSDGCAPSTATTSEKTPTVLDKISGLVGATEFKALCKEIASISDEIKRTKTYEVLMNQCYLFSIGDGCGLSTYLNLLAELLGELHLCEMSSRPVREARLDVYRESAEPFEDARHAVESGAPDSVKVVCVDISEWMDKTNSRFFKQFLRTVEKCANDHILAFRVPFVDKDVLARIKYSLSDLVSVKTVSFPPLSQDEVKACAEAELKHYNFAMTNSAWKFFFDRISEEKSDGKFYGIKTVKKVVRELVYQKHIANSHKTEKSNQIGVNDAKLLCSDISDANLSGAEQLNKLVGVDGIKQRVEEIIAQIELSVKSGSADRPCIHMRFVGNPGTGKTTVARIIGKILKEKGILRVGAFFEYAGRDFCGRYIGETAPKTSSICRDAYGSVLFIDEAYTLYRSNDPDNKDYGREALDTLIAEMENHRNDFVVILAGYTDEMNKLMNGNLGLASRMPYTIEFPNFTREQLYEIFVSMVKDKFKCDEGLFESARKFFMDLPDSTLSSKDFSNARYVRNLFERTWAKAAMRCQLGGKSDIVLTRDDFEHASADKEFVVNSVPKRARIGF
ncbi:MAG: AAA family ATPase [Clostridiales bacterium]|nr:AAA family ATPase [Clostridiales bacterium]